MRLASLALVTALNLFLRRKLPAELFERLRGKEVQLDVRDLRIVVAFRIVESHFVPVRPASSPEVRFRATSRDFAAIAARVDDSDTLFFNRRLVVEGDTELALLVKNTLDTVEIPHTRKLLRRALRLAELPLGR